MRSAAGVQAVPVDRRSGEPQAPERLERQGVVGDGLLRTAQRGEDEVRVLPIGMSAGERAERLARADLEQDPAGLREERPQRLRRTAPAAGAVVPSTRGSSPRPL